MSELAFNVNGEPFEVPPTAARWRVKKMKPKGAPEVAFGRDGIPLTLPIDADMDDLRQEARAEGKYRLDPIDDQGQPIAGAPFGYVYLYADEASELAPVTRRAPAESVIAEALRMNTELASKVVDRFPMMIEAVAGLIRAADGAGLPARAPRALPEPTVDEDDQGDDAAEAPTKASGWAGLLETLLPMVTPAIAAAIAGGKLQIPGGLGALFDCRRAVPKGSAAAARTASTPGAVPAPGPHDPAPAGRTVPHSTTRGQRASTAAASRSEGESRSPQSTEEPGSGLATVAEPVAAPPEELPMLDPASLAHFVAIQSALSLSERMWTQAMATELTPAELRAWLAELLAVSVPDGVAKIRAVLAANGHGNAHQGGGAS